ncbi:MAG: response regulator, partial [Bryobacteraceae bacterium]
LQGIALNAVKKKFSPEFVNRIDAVITYSPLDATALTTILDYQISQLQNHVNNRLGARNFVIEVPFESRQVLLRLGTSPQHGARELNRTIHRQLTQPLATMVATGQVPPGSRVRAEIPEGMQELRLRVVEPSMAEMPAIPTVLIVDDNRDLLRFLERLLAQSGWKLMTAESAREARELVANEKPSAALLDYLLPDGNGVDLGVRLRKSLPSMPIIIMSGMDLPGEDQIVCEAQDFPVVRKPFLAGDIVSQIYNRLRAAGQAKTAN